MLTDVVIPFKVCYFGSILIQVKVWLHVSDLDVGLDKRRKVYMCQFYLIKQTKLEVL